MILSTDILDALNNEGWPVNPGDLGENLTLTNIDYSIMALGDRLKIRDVTLEISLICDPCTNLNNLPYVGKEKSASFIKTLMKRRGWYARVLKSGEVSVGDSVTLIQ
jgi:molybdopterin adenylyltransferase